MKDLDDSRCRIPLVDIFQLKMYSYQVRNRPPTLTRQAIVSPIIQNLIKKTNINNIYINE